MHPATLPLEELQCDCAIARTRRSGPGGQHRNKVETAVVITHRPSGIRGEASERRSQAQNQDVAWQRLRVQLALELRTAWPEERAVSQLWRTRAKGGKLSVNPEHVDFPALLAEALDRLATLDFDVVLAAEQLAVSSSQLVKFLKLHPQALQQLNHARQQRGQHLLK